MDDQTAYYVKYFQTWQREYHKADERFAVYPNADSYMKMRAEYQEKAAEAYRCIVNWRGF